MIGTVDHFKVSNVEQVTYEGTAENKEPIFTESSPALCLYLHSRLAALSQHKLRARAGTLYLPHGRVRTPVFMPVGECLTLNSREKCGYNELHLFVSHGSASSCSISPSFLKSF